MITLVSQDEKGSLSANAAGLILDDGDMVLVASEGEIDKIGGWLGDNGL